MGVAEGIPSQIHPDLAGRAEYTGPPLDLATRIAEAGGMLSAVRYSRHLEFTLILILCSVSRRASGL